MTRSSPRGVDDQRDQAADYGELTGALNDFVSEAATVDGVSKAHPPAATAQFSSTADEALPDELLPTIDVVIADEPGASERPLWAGETASGEHALDAFPSKSARASAPWRSPEEMLVGAPTPRTEAYEPLDDPLNPSDNSAASWDVAPVYPPSHTDVSTTDPTMSIAATPVPAFGFRWLGMVAMTFLLFAIGMSLLPADGPGVPSAVTSERATTAPEMQSLDPASSDSVEKVAGTAGVVPGPADPRATTEPAPAINPSAAVNGPAARDNAPSIPGNLSAADWLARGGRQSAPPSSRPSLPSPPSGSNAASPTLSKDTPVDTTGARREDVRTSAVARSNRSDATDVVAPADAPAPPRNDATTPPPPPPAAELVARTEEPSPPAALSSDTTDRTLPTTMTGESTARAAAPAVPAIPPAVTDDRAGTAGEAAAIDAITATLRRLQLAYEHRDAALAKAVWPTVNQRALARAFDGLRSQSVTFDSCWMNVFSVSADVECRGVTTYVPRVGGQYQRTESRQWTFRVEKGDDRWLITSAEAR